MSYLQFLHHGNIQVISHVNGEFTDRTVAHDHNDTITSTPTKTVPAESTPKIYPDLHTPQKFITW